MLKDADLTWIREDDHLKNIMRKFFSALYTSDINRNYGPILAKCPPTVTLEMNNILTA